MPRSRSASFDTYNDVYRENDDPYDNDNLKGNGSDRRSRSSRSRSGDRSSSRSRSKSRGRHRSPSRSPSRDRRRSLSEKADDRTSFTGMLDFTSIPSTGHHDLLRASWDTVFYNKDNFDAWTDLLTKVEQLNDINAARDVFEPFLVRYPYCYGYWRKYAEFERRSGNLEKAMSVWERSVSAIPLCIDLWLPFLAFFRELALHAEGGLEKTREIMERAMMSAGMEYNSDRLWADVIQFELAQNNPRRVMVLYERLLGIPTALHVQQFEKFQLFVNSFEPNEILDEEEYRDIFSKVKKAVEIGVDQMIVEERIALATNGSGAPGDEQYIVKRRHVPEVLRVFRDEIIARRRTLHLETAGQVMKRAPFEEKIKRPYFHVKPLDPLEFENWRQYLDMEIDAAKDARVIVLFERCLIATALYDEFWIKYARWRWRRSGDEGAARSVFQRAVTVHCRKRPVVHLAYSAFEESVGNYDEAERILRQIADTIPGLVMVDMRLRGLERRRANYLAKKRGLDAPDYSTFIQNYEKCVQDEKNTPRLKSYYSIKLAQVHSKLRNDPDLGMRVIKEALRTDPGNNKLMLQLVDIAMDVKPIDENKVIEAFDYCLQLKLASTDKLEISQRKMEFLEEFCSNIHLLQDHLDFHSDLVHKSDQRLARKRLHLIEQSISERSRRDGDLKRSRTTIRTMNRAHNERDRDRGRERERDRDRDRDRDRERDRDRDRERDRDRRDDRERSRDREKYHSSRRSHRDREGRDRDRD